MVLNRSGFWPPGDIWQCPDILGCYSGWVGEDATGTLWTEDREAGKHSRMHGTPQNIKALFQECWKPQSNSSTNKKQAERTSTLSLLSYCCSVAQSCLTLCDPMDCRLPRPSPSPGACSNSGPLSQWCHPTISSSVVPFSSCLQSFPASGSFLMSSIFTSDMTIYWSFSLSISPSNEYSGLISFRIDWLDLLAVQGTLNSLLQHHSSKAVIETYLILRCMHIFLIYLLYHWLSVPLIIHIISYCNKYIL